MAHLLVKMDRQYMVIFTILVSSGLISCDTILAFRARINDDQLSKRQQTTPNYFGNFNPNSMMASMLGGGGGTGMGMFNPNNMMAGGGGGGNMFNSNTMMGGGGGGGGTGSNSGSGSGLFNPNQASSGGGSGTGSSTSPSGGSFDPNNANGGQIPGGLSPGGGIPKYDPNNVVNTGAKYDPNSANSGMGTGASSPAFLTGMGLNPQQQSPNGGPPGAGSGSIAPGSQQKPLQSQSGGGGAGNIDPNHGSSSGSGLPQAAQSFGSSSGGSNSAGGAASSFGSSGSASGFGSSQQSAGTGSSSGGQINGGSSGGQMNGGLFGGQMNGSSSGGQMNGGSSGGQMNGGSSVSGQSFDPIKANSMATDGFNPLSPVLGKDMSQLMGPQANANASNPANFNPGAINSLMASNGASLNMFGGAKLGGDPSKMDASSVMTGGNAFNSGAMGAGGTGTSSGGGLNVFNPMAMMGGGTGGSGASGGSSGGSSGNGGMNMFDPNAMMGGGSMNPMMPGGGTNPMMPAGGMNPMMPGGSMTGGTNTNTNTMMQGSTGMNPMGVNQLDPLGAMLGGAKNFSGGSNLMDPMGFMNGGGLSGNMGNIFDIGKHGRSAGILKDATIPIIRKRDLSSGLMVQTGRGHNPMNPLSFLSGPNAFELPSNLLQHAEPFVNYNLENLSGISVESEDMLSTTETTSKDKPLGLSLNDFLGNYVSGNMNLYSGFINGYTGMIGTGQIPSLGPRHQTLKLQQQVNSPNNQKESRDPSASSQISLTSGFISGYPGMLGLDNPKMAQLNNQIKVSRTNNEGQLPYGTDRGAHVSNDYIPSTFETDYSFKPGYFGQIASVDKDLISEQSEFGNTANRPGQLPHAYSTDDFGTNTFGQIGSSAKERTSSQMSNDSEFGNSVAHGIDPEQNGDVKGSSHSVNWNGEWPGQTSLRAGVNTGNDKSQPGNFGPQAFGGTEPKTWDGSWAEGWPEHSDKNNNSAKVFNDLKTLLDRMTSNSG